MIRTKISEIGTTSVLAKDGKGEAEAYTHVAVTIAGHFPGSDRPGDLEHDEEVRCPIPVPQSTTIDACERCGIG